MAFSSCFLGFLTFFEPWFMMIGSNSYNRNMFRSKFSKFSMKYRAIILQCVVVEFGTVDRVQGDKFVVDRVLVTFAIQAYCFIP